MVEKVVKFLVRNAIIAPEETEIYQYGLALIVKKILHTLVILLIGFWGGEFLGILIFLIAYAGIREYAGGYHAKTEIGCYCCTGAVTLCTLFLLHVFPLIYIGWIYLLLIICGITIWLSSPLEAHNKPLEIEEKSVYRKKAHVYLALEGFICLGGFFCKLLLFGVVCAWIIQVIMILAGWLSKKREMIIISSK